MDKIKLKELLLLSNFIDNEYLEKYINIVCTKNELGQIHHIIPRSWYRLNDKEINNNSNNLVKLSILNHILAHYYLSLCTVGRLKYCQLFAFLHMTLEKLFPEERELVLKLPLYESIYNSYIKEHSKVVSESNLKRYANETDEQKIKRIESLKNARKNTKYRWYTDGVVSRFLIEGTQPEGFYLGQSDDLKRKNSHPAWNKGIKNYTPVSLETREKKSNSLKEFYKSHPESKSKRGINLPWYTNGIENKKLSPDLVDEYVSNGWRKGMVHNKNKKKLTEKTP